MVSAEKLTHFLRRLLPIESQTLAEVYVLLDVTDFPVDSFNSATLDIHQGGTALHHPLDATNPAFVESVI